MKEAVKAIISSSVVPWDIKRGSLKQLRLLFEPLSGKERKFLANYVYKTDCLNVTPLQEAVREGQPTIVEFLLNCGAQPDQTSGDFNQSLLYSAALRGMHDVADNLLKAGADPHWFPDKQDDGLDPLEVLPLCAACRDGDVFMVNLLLQHGAQVERRDFRRETCLFHAVRSRCRDVIDVLLNQGASVKAVNAYKDSPVTLAKTYWPEIVDVLVAVQKPHTPKTGLQRASGSESDLKFFSSWVHFRALNE